MSVVVAGPTVTDMAGGSHCDHANGGWLMTFGKNVVGSSPALYRAASISGDLLCALAWSEMSRSVAGEPMCADLLRHLLSGHHMRPRAA
ncbi:hypothetical protein [Nocardia sp. NPDC002869]|uniref:hypothetical protein n=1 Tax=Nocardia sp. NPDC002869 TaxID=3161032 RepID=UPI00398CFE83